MTDESTTRQRGSQLLMNCYRRQPITFVAGNGCQLVAADGVAYLDCLAGLAVSTLGHGHPAVVAAIAQASTAPLHVSNLYWSEPMVRLAERLLDATGMERVFFGNSGTEAIEAAIKLARRALPERSKVVVFERSFHGRTMGALSATAQPAYQEAFRPLLPGFCAYRYGADLPDGAIDRDTALVLVEPIQGEGGIRPAPSGWLAQVARAAREAGALLALDEVQTGVGRTGKFLACHHDRVTPDIVCLAKGLAGGLPIGAMAAKGAAAGAFRPGDHGSTFGGGPFVATVALAVMETVMGDGFLAQVALRGRELEKFLAEVCQRSPLVAEVRGRGLMQGLVLREAMAAEVVNAALDQRLLLAPAGPDVVRLVPPLTITRNELALATRRLAAALDQVSGYNPSGSPANRAAAIQEGTGAALAQ